MARLTKKTKAIKTLLASAQQNERELLFVVETLRSFVREHHKQDKHLEQKIKTLLSSKDKTNIGEAGRLVRERQGALERQKPYLAEAVKALSALDDPCHRGKPLAAETIAYHQNLRGLPMGFLCLEHIGLQKAGLVFAGLVGARLNQADMRGANFYGASLWGRMVARGRFAGSKPRPSGATRCRFLGSTAGGRGWFAGGKFMAG